MKCKTLKIKFEGWDSFKKRMGKSLKAQTRSVQSKDVILFASVAAYQKFMSEQKLAILATINVQAPTSIYQLAQLVDRDFANVQRDCVALASMGFIAFKDADNNKNSKTPVLAFDYSAIEIHMPNVIYGHNLGKAA